MSLWYHQGLALARSNARQVCRKAQNRFVLVVLPLVYLIVIVILDRVIPPKTYAAQPAQALSSVPISTPLPVASPLLVFAPAGAFTEYVASFVSNSSARCQMCTFAGARTLVVDNDSAVPAQGVYAFVHFTNLVAGGSGGGTPAASTVDVTLRFNSSLLPSTSDVFANQASCRNNLGCSSAQYVFSGFLDMQSELASAVAAQLPPSSSSVALRVAGQTGYFAEPEYLNTNSWLGLLLAIYTVLSFWPLVANVIALIVLEKEKKQKEASFIMGLTDVGYYVGLFVFFGAVAVLTTLLMGLLINLGVLKHSNFFLIWIQLLLYALCSIGYAVCLASFFEQAKLASAFGTLFAIALSVIAIPVLSNPTAFSGAGLWALCLLAPVALALGMGQSFTLDTTAGGLQFGNEWASVITPGFSVGAATVMMLVDIPLYFALAWYFDRVVPSSVGPKAKPWFVCSRAYWRPPAPLALSDLPPLPPSPDVEPLGPEESVAISIRGLGKTYPRSLDRSLPKSKPALVDVNLDIPAGSIFGLIGHNGSGKSTLLSILTGMVPATTGSATIFGLDTATRMQDIRRWTGFCPQYDVVYDFLTVREHLVLFSHIKGVADPQGDAARLIGQFYLGDCESRYAHVLSGGQKRKLCVAMALCGDSRLLVLDEPTNALDVHARAQLWSALRANQRGRVIVVASHILEEIDVHASRKVMLEEGRVRCCGSSLFLKKRFETGYGLVVQLKDAANADVVTALLPEGLRTTTLLGRRLNVTLPDASVMRPILEALDRSAAVENYHIHVTSLEDVFLRLDNWRHTDVERAALPPARVQPPRWFEQGLVLYRYKWWLVRRRPVLYGAFLFSALVLQIVGLVVGLFASPTSSSPPSLVLSSALPATGVPLVNQTTEPITQWAAGLGAPWTLLVSSPNMSAPLLGLNASLLGALTVNALPLVVNASLGINATWNPGFAALWGAVVSASLQNASAGAPAMNFTAWPLTSGSTQSGGNLLGSVLLLGVALLTLPVYLAAELVRERSNKLRHLFALNGLEPAAYWGATMGRDLGLAYIIALSTFVLILAFQMPCLIGNALLPVVILLLLFVPVSLLFAYLLAMRFEDGDTFTRAATAVATFLVLLPYIVVSVLSLVGYASVATTLHYVFMAIDPFYDFMGTLFFVCNVAPNGGAPMSSYFAFASVVPGSLLIVLAHVIIGASAIALTERVGLKPLRAAKTGFVPVDSDAADEMRRIQSSEAADVCQSRGLEKRFGAKVACHDLWFGVSVGECFGLLGPNGSGKSTAISMLTGEVVADSGCAVVDGHVVEPAMRTRLGLLALDPQFDSLYDDLTPEEHLWLFGSIKGVLDIDDRARQVVDLVGLHEWKGQVARNLSGGSKRKLQFALAVMADPQLLVLDEPTAGMDPASRHVVWASIRSTVASRACVLTTHSMDEADALVSRIGIITSGTMRAVGTSAHLKAKFGHGYRLEVKLDSTFAMGAAPAAADARSKSGKTRAEEELDCMLASEFEESEVQLRDGSRVVCRVQGFRGRSLADMFHALERRRAEGGWMREYLFAEATLEQVFQTIVSSDSPAAAAAAAAASPATRSAPAAAKSEYPESQPQPRAIRLLLRGWRAVTARTRTHDVAQAHESGQSMA